MIVTFTVSVRSLLSTFVLLYIIAGSLPAVVALASLPPVLIQLVALAAAGLAFVFVFHNKRV